MIYGHENTIHRTNLVNVEVDKNGKVVSVWFRCMPLPFDQRVVGTDRSKEMRSMYKEASETRILAIEIEGENL